MRYSGDDVRYRTCGCGITCDWYVRVRVRYYKVRRVGHRGLVFCFIIYRRLRTTTYRGTLCCFGLYCFCFSLFVLFEICQHNCCFCCFWKVPRRGLLGEGAVWSKTAFLSPYIYSSLFFRREKKSELRGGFFCFGLYSFFLTSPSGTSRIVPDYTLN